MGGVGFWGAGLGWNLELAGAGFGARCAADFAAQCFSGTLCLCQRDCFSGVVETGFKTTACAAADFPGAGSRLTSAAGLTPAEIAALAADAESGGWRSAPRKAGFTMIWWSSRRSTDSSLSDC